MTSRPSTEPLGSGSPSRTTWREHRLAGLLFPLAIFVVGSTISRLALLFLARHDVTWDSGLLTAVALGFGFDLLTGTLLALPFTLYLTVASPRFFLRPTSRRIFQALLVVAIYFQALIGMAEWFFWDELGTRFNFIAVDYLVYTREVIGDIREAYPVPTILAILAVVTAAIAVPLLRSATLRTWQRSPAAARRRLGAGALAIVLPLGAVAVVKENHIPAFADNRHVELAKNGVFSFFAAFNTAQLDYRGFFPVVDDRAALLRLRGLLAADGSRFLGDAPGDLRRRVDTGAPERHLNIIQITVESLSASFLGRPDNLTPNLDRLVRESLVFTDFYATGTRTTRAMEALTLSLPPTPGRAILHRPGHTGLFTLGTVLRGRGYETEFIYGGHGAFDSMNSFFGGNGYRVLDRAEVPAKEVTFANIWGACDEDLFHWTLAEADRAAAAGKPFYFFVMTTSNHTPYTYPDGRIDIPSKTGRLGGVKYTDYAIGDLLRQARTRPWFDDTLFVIVGDHTASAAGHDELEVTRFRVPLVIYNPKLLPARRVTTQSSQVDVPPTLLGLLGGTYDSLFFGKDILKLRPDQGRAFVANHEVLGYLVGDRLELLKVPRVAESLLFDGATGRVSPATPQEDLRLDAIAYYQGASITFSSGRSRETTFTQPASR